MNEEKIDKKKLVAQVHTFNKRLKAFFVNPNFRKTILDNASVNSARSA